jgi:hypothetical protein
MDRLINLNIELKIFDSDRQVDKNSCSAAGNFGERRPSGAASPAPLAVTRAGGFHETIAEGPQTGAKPSRRHA